MDVFNNIGDHSKSSTLQLWLPVSMMSFSHFFNLTQRQFLLSIHSYCHHFGGSFMVELRFFCCHYWGQHHQQQQQTNNMMMSSCIFGKTTF
jgi:sugar phosphate permease